MKNLDEATSKNSEPLALIEMLVTGGGEIERGEFNSVDEVFALLDDVGNVSLSVEP